ncbi:3-dehydroquinate synthase [Elusimicrobium simillimum]|uniref:3-dehydroquinate synthase n=1 Tax=Elusimicrobium simillimum TaxID=3143438 RepID=UPI003C6F1F74
MSVDFLIEGKTFKMPDNFNALDTFTVNSVPRPYNVSIKYDGAPVKELQALMDANKNNLLLIDANVYNLYYKDLKVDAKRIFIADATEEFKTLDGVTKVIAFLEENDFTKTEKLYVIGGGIIEDVGAFVGAVYKRGIKWVYYPTTLLSMCDSCIGGKTGINHNKAKNQLALFSAPAEVIINTAFLKTLTDYHIKSGMGEILKLLVTGGAKPLQVYIDSVENGKAKTFDAYKTLIMSSLAVKRAVVEEDEFELNHRRSLNYGHTVGHAIEVLSNYEIPHGQAVIIGMVIVNKLSKNRNILNDADYELTQRLSKELLGPSLVKQVSLDGLNKLLKKDKKTEGNLVNFVIISKLGDTQFLKLPLDENLFNEISEAIQKEF